MAALAAADTIGVADVDTALNRTRGGRGSISGADPGQWEALLAEWARRQLAEGVEGLHAQVRERVDHALLEAALQITHGAAPKPLPAWAWAAIPLPASWALSAAAGPLNGPCTRSSRPLAEPLIVHGRCRP